MSILQAILLGLLQGLTEFLPVSSSGHLVLVPWALGWHDPGLTYDLVVHLGTLTAVVVYFWDDIKSLAAGALEIIQTRRINSFASRLALLVLLSAIPGALLGFFLEDAFERVFGAPLAVAALLAVTGSLLIGSEYLAKRARAAKREVRDLDQMGSTRALLIGLAQGLAIAPGLSRSGATISAGLTVGLTREAAARFSFLMALPIIIGAAGYQLLKVASADSLSAEWVMLVTGFGAAALSGYVAIRFLLAFVQRHTLFPFAFYCWSVSLLTIAVLVVG
jgi:undecaprenyl-diphosphatase